MNIGQFKTEFFSLLSPLYDAEEIEAVFFQLMQFHLKKSRAQTVLSYAEPLEASALNLLRASTQRLEQGAPLQYIMGVVAFCGCMLNACEGVLIPRPETEALVYWMAQEHPKGGNTLDICTGSGCIGLGFSKLTNANVTGWDVSDKALLCAASNAQRNDISMQLANVDILEAPSSVQSWDLIVANPPYVLESEKATMHTNVLDYEPHAALFVPNEDPIVFYKALADFAIQHLVPGGCLYFELNPLTSNEVERFLKTKGFTDIVVVNDMRGHPRMMRSKKP